MRNLILFCSLLLITISCHKSNVGKNIELYLLSSYQLVPGKCMIDSSTAVLQNTPLIKNDDIIYYTRSSYQYTISNTALEKVRQLIGRTPFAITLDKKVIYYGVYMPSILSSTCFNSITMAESWDLTSSISMKLGYPGTLAGVGIDDQRDSQSLITSLRSQGKLR